MVVAVLRQLGVVVVVDRQLGVVVEQRFQQLPEQLTITLQRR